MFCLYFTAKLLTFHSAKVISLGGRWSDSKGSVINANDTPSFPFVYVIISVSCGTSLSTLTVESHPSFMSIFYLLSTGPREIYCYDSFKWKPPRCNYYVTSETTPWRGTTSKPKRKEEKSHAIIQSLNIVTIDKPKSSIAPIFGDPEEEEEEDDVEEDGIEEDDFEEDTDFSSGTKSHSISKRENVNNFVR